MNFYIFSKIILIVLYIKVHIVIAVHKSMIINLENIGLKDNRNLGVIYRVFNKYGFVMCARQCEKLKYCKGFNYKRSDLLCELLDDIEDNQGDSVGCQFVNISAILEDNTLSTQSRGKICESKGSNIQLTSGSFFCLNRDYPIDCGDSALIPPEAQSGVYKVKPKTGVKEIKVFCDMETNENGWTVIQKRTDGSVNFNLIWKNYRNGFGNLMGEHWLGNDVLYTFTSAHKYILRIEMTTTGGGYKHATYSQFSVANDNDNFRLTVSGYTGNAGDALTSSNGWGFSTKDKDNDFYSSHHCSFSYGGGWWFNSCIYSNLNKLSTCVGCVDVHWEQNMLQLKSVTMKIKRAV